MDNLSIFKCKNCGGELDVRKAQNGVVACAYCGTVWTVPKQETPPDARKYLHDGNAALDVCKFEDAFTYFQKAAEFDKDEPEAYFGLALASFKVQYLKDEVNNNLQPICHEISDKVFTEDRNYKKALELATVEQKKVYRKKGGEIDDIRDEFFALKDKGLTYDCFICVKVTEEDGSHTADRERASMIYEHLKDSGYNPFFSEREMKGQTGSAYEALILYALYTSECMLIVCSNEDYLQTKWVKNEYTRFIGLMSEGGKERDALTFVFAGKPIEKLPTGKKIQGIDLSKPDAYSRITEFVKNHTVAAKKQKEIEALAKKEQEEAWRRQIEEKNRLLEEEQNRQLQALKSEVEKATRGARSTIGDRLTRAWQEMDARAFTRATNYFTSVLDSDPKNAEAWRGLFLVDFKVTSEQALLTHLTEESVNIIADNKNLKNFLRFKQKDQFDDVYAQIKEKANAVIAAEQAKHQTVIKKCKSGILLRRILNVGLAAVAGALVYVILYSAIPGILNAIFRSWNVHFNRVFCIVAAVAGSIAGLFILHGVFDVSNPKEKMQTETQTLEGLNTLLNSVNETFA